MRFLELLKKSIVFSDNIFPNNFGYKNMHDFPPPPSFHYVVNLAGIIQLPPNADKNVPYKDLVCTEQDKAIIVELITSIADNSKFDLLLKQHYIRGLGAKINHVYPLKFLAVATGTERLKRAFVAIFDDYFKRTSFLDGFSSSMDREAGKGTLNLYLPDFVIETGIPRERLDPYFLSRDWEGLLRFLTRQ